MSHLTILLFGSPKIMWQGSELAFSRRKAIALLAYLAVEQRQHTRESLGTLFWPDYGRKASLAYLRRSLWKLNQQIPADVIVASRQDVQLSLPVEQVDVNHFQRLLQQVAEHHQDGKLCQICLEKLETAQSLYQSAFMEGFSLEDAVEYDNWQSVKQSNLRQQALGGQKKLAFGWGKVGELERAVLAGQRWVALDSLNEEAHRTLMQLYVAEGRRKAALEQYEFCRHLLYQELKLRPSPATETLVQSIRDNHPIAESPFSTAPTPVTVVTPAAPKAVEYQYEVPVFLTTFMGREEEIAGIRQRLSEPNCHLLTLTGFGGMGKTSLAIAATEQLRPDYPDGIFFVDLADIDMGDLLIIAIAEVMTFRFFGKEPAQTQLVRFLKGKKCLLVLDNFEHLIEYAPLLTDLLQQAPDVKMMVTSRERLRLREEWRFALNGLPYPADKGTDDLESYASVQLFVARVQQEDAYYQPTADDMKTIAHICRLLEGIPLAIELAASWSDIMTVAEIAQELTVDTGMLSSAHRNIVSRHRSLQATFDYSWQLLYPNERQALATMSCFRGDFQYEAVAKIAGISRRDLATLVDKSLVRRANDKNRYQLVEVIRQFCGEKLALDPSYQQIAFTQHATYYIEVLHDALDQLYGRHPRAMRKQLEQDLGNIRAAWRWSAQQGQDALLQRGIEALAEFYDAQNWYLEGEAVFNDALASLPPSAASLTRGLMMINAGNFHTNLGQYEKANALFQEALPLFLSNPNAERAQALSTSYYAFYLRQVGQYETAEEFSRKTIMLWERVGDRRLLAKAYNALGIVLAIQNKMSEAHTCFLEAEAMSQEQGFIRFISGAKQNLGNLHALTGKNTEAVRYFQEVLMLTEETQERFAEAGIHTGLAELALEDKNNEQAVEHYHKGVALYRAIGFQYGLADSLIGLGRAYIAVGQLALAIPNMEQALRLANEIDSLPMLLNGLMGVAKLSVAQGEQKLGMRLATFVQGHEATQGQTKQLVEELLTEVGDVACVALSEENAGNTVSISQHYSNALNWLQNQR